MATGPVALAKQMVWAMLEDVEVGGRRGPGPPQLPGGSGPTRARTLGQARPPGPQRGLQPRRCTTGP
eukprot:11048657-Alexandrium_andersonii.AAC.1